MMKTFVAPPEFWGGLVGGVLTAAVLASAIEVTAELPAPEAATESAVPRRLVSRAWSIMGTIFELRLETERPEEAQKLLHSAWAELDKVDRLMSSYRPDSDISRLEPGFCTPVHEETASVLSFALHFCEQSGGSFDVTVGPLLEAWGLTGRNGRIPSAEELYSARARVGCSRVWLEDEGRCVRLLQGTRVDLGGVAKGDALDRARARLSERNVPWASLDLGGQLHHIGGGHCVVVLHPMHPGRLLARFQVMDESVSTSAASERFVEVGGRRYGHILDPRTGYPAEAMLSVTVTHPSARVADVLSTFLFVRDREGLRWALTRFPRAGALLIEEPGSGRRLESRHVVVAGTLEGRVSLALDGEGRGRVRGLESERVKE